jgi:hypothetical protein
MPAGWGRIWREIVRRRPGNAAFIITWRRLLPCRAENLIASIKPNTSQSGLYTQDSPALSTERKRPLDWAAEKPWATGRLGWAVINRTIWPLLNRIGRPCIQNFKQYSTYFLQMDPNLEHMCNLWGQTTFILGVFKILTKNTIFILLLWKQVFLWSTYLNYVWKFGHTNLWWEWTSCDAQMTILF